MEFRSIPGEPKVMDGGWGVETPHRRDAANKKGTAVKPSLWGSGKAFPLQKWIAWPSAARVASWMTSDIVGWAWIVAWISSEVSS